MRKALPTINALVAGDDGDTTVTVPKIVAPDKAPRAVRGYFERLASQRDTDVQAMTDLDAELEALAKSRLQLLARKRLLAAEISGFDRAIALWHEMAAPDELETEAAVADWSEPVAHAEAA